MWTVLVILVVIAGNGIGVQATRGEIGESSKPTLSMLTVPNFVDSKGNPISPIQLGLSPIQKAISSEPRSGSRSSSRERSSPSNLPIPVEREKLRLITNPAIPEAGIQNLLTVKERGKRKHSPILTPIAQAYKKPKTGSGMKIRDFNLLKLLKGQERSFVFVAVAEHKKTGHIYALKMIIPNKNYPVTAVNDERRILESTKSVMWAPGFHHAFVDGGWACITMDYIPGGTLEDHFLGGRIDTNDVELVRRIVAAGIIIVENLHDWYVLHGDLMLKNWLITEEGDLAAADFGSSKVLDHLSRPNFNKESQIDWLSFGYNIKDIIGNRVPHRDEFVNLFAKITDLEITTKIKFHKFFDGFPWDDLSIGNLKAPFGRIPLQARINELKADAPEGVDAYANYFNLGSGELSKSDAEGLVGFPYPEST